MVIYNFFKNLFLNIKYTRLIKKVYKEEHLLENLSVLFKSNFKLDWIGRAYTVLNPNLDENGVYSQNSLIFEYGENGLNTSSMMEHWVFDRLGVVSDFIKANNLFDLLTYSIDKLDDYDNYLFVLEPITLKDCLKWSKRMAILMGIIIVAVIMTLILI